MQRLLEDFALLKEDGYDVILCSSGSVALGMKMIDVDPESAGLRDKQAAAACGMPLLLNAYKQIGHEYDLNIAQILVTLDDLEGRSRFLNTKNTLHRLLKAGIVPIINENDTVTTEEIRVGDNDRLSSKVAQMMQAEYLVILTSVDGLYDRNPSEEGAQLVETVHDVSEYLEVSTGVSTLGSGGMLTKLQAANMAQNSGCTTFIANGEANDPVSSVINGTRRCTKCVAHSKPLESWHSWLSERLHMAGSLVISEQAAAEIAADGRGIHREDVVSIDGRFQKGDVLHIYDEKGAERARGMTDFSSDEAAILVRNLDIPVKQLLGYHSRAVLIEVNNLISLDERHIPWDQEDVRVKDILTPGSGKATSSSQ